MLLNILVTNLVLRVKNLDLHNFVDNYTLALISGNLKKLFSNLECVSKDVVKWFRNSTMILNPNKFQFIIIDHTKTNYTTQISNIDVNEIKSLIV